MATAVGEEDAAAWVNAVLAEAAADGGTVDSRIASVSLKLQTMSADLHADCLLYTSPSPRDKRQSRMPSSA